MAKILWKRKKYMKKQTEEEEEPAYVSDHDDDDMMAMPPMMAVVMVTMRKRSDPFLAFDAKGGEDLKHFLDSDLFFSKLQSILIYLSYQTLSVRLMDLDLLFVIIVLNNVCNS